jgi:peptide/nickel transport system substrate-binding protein
MRRRDFLAGLAATSLPMPAIAQPASSRVLKVIHAANLAILDPIWTTAPATKDYAFLVYDQLISVDADYVPRPQMAEGWSVEDDGKAYLIGLREGLKFHDGEPVRSQDCIASIRRWAARDGFGQTLGAAIASMDVVDDRRFRIRLKSPFPLLPAAIGKSNSSQCFIMPERVAKTDPMTQIKEHIGSGPFRFLRDEWVPGARAAWAKFEDYVPRQEPVSGIAGGRVAKVDRLEWAIISDPATASAAMMRGEHDYWDQVLFDLIPTLQRSGNLVVQSRVAGGTYGMLRFNQLHPPFNNPELRLAVASAVDQSDYMRAVAGDDPENWATCLSFFACGKPYASDEGADVLKRRNVEKAREMVRAAGYKGERVVQIAATDNAAINVMSQVTQDLLRRLGFNVDYIATDFGAMAQRRVSREPVERGGWSVFHTSWNAPDIVNPAVNQMLRASGGKGWFGWPTDEALEKLRAQWFDATDPAKQSRLATAIQVQAYKTLPYIPLGNYIQRHAWNKRVSGVHSAPTTVYWNISKDG